MARRRKDFDYQRYLASREWAVRKEAVRDRSRGECERCRKAPMRSVHHLTYEHIGDEPLEDLQATCGACHDFLSGKSDRDPVTSLTECERRVHEATAAYFRSVASIFRDCRTKFEAVAVSQLLYQDATRIADNALGAIADCERELTEWESA